MHRIYTTTGVCAAITGGVLIALSACRIRIGRIDRDTVPRTGTKSVQCAGHRERSELQVIIGVAFVIHDRADNVGTREKFTGSVVIVFEIVVQVKRLPSLNGDDSIYAPAVANDFVAAVRSVGKLVNKVPGDTIANIEIGVPAIEPIGSLAVIRLRGVGDIIFPVARIVNRM